MMERIIYRFDIVSSRQFARDSKIDAFRSFLFCLTIFPARFIIHSWNTHATLASDAFKFRCFGARWNDFGECDARDARECRWHIAIDDRNQSEQFLVFSVGNTNYVEGKHVNELIGIDSRAHIVCLWELFSCSAFSVRRCARTYEASVGRPELKYFQRLEWS